MRKNKKYPRFSPTRTENHPILGMVKIYDIGKYPTPDDDGAQTSFFTNNAKVNNAKQFGIKMFSTSIEAFAAYQRQTLAAKAGLAPPTGKMIRWIVKRITDGRTVNRWGYETAIADCSDDARNKATILSCPQITSWYGAYVRRFGYTMYSSHSMLRFLDDTDTEERINANEITFSQFSCASATTVKGSLRKQLMKIDLTGTQYDNVVACVDGWNESVDEWQGNNPRLRLGEKVTAEDDMMMSNDLHRGNIGLWKGKCVAIDFGYHIAVSEYRDHDCVKTIRNFKKKVAA